MTRYISDMSHIGMNTLPSASGCGFKHSIRVGYAPALTMDEALVMSKLGFGTARAEHYLTWAKTRAPKAAIIRALLLCGSTAMVDGELSTYPTEHEFFAGAHRDGLILEQLRSSVISGVVAKPLYDVHSEGVDREVYTDRDANLKFTLPLSNEIVLLPLLAVGGVR